MIILCALRDVEMYRARLEEAYGEKPAIYRTTVGKNYGMDKYENLPFFNPSWDIVQGVKKGLITPQQYRDEYNRILNSAKNKAACFAFTQSLRPHKGYILLCYCRPGEFCHRQIIAEKLRKHRPDLVIEVH